MTPTIIEGRLSGTGCRFAVVVARFNSLVTDRLLSGALEALEKTGVEAANIAIFKVPGSWEMPVVVRQLVSGGRFDGVICLGAVVRGDTPHFDYVAGEAAKGIAGASAESGVPVAFGVLTTNTMEQALDRAGGKSGNKGYEAALTAVEMASLLASIRQLPN